MGFEIKLNEVIAVFAGIGLSIGGWFIASPLKDFITEKVKFTWALPVIGIVIICAVLYFYNKK